MFDFINLTYYFTIHSTSYLLFFIFIYFYSSLSLPTTVASSHNPPPPYIHNLIPLEIHHHPQNRNLPSQAFEKPKSNKNILQHITKKTQIRKKKPPSPKSKDKKNPNFGEKNPNLKNPNHHNSLREREREREAIRETSERREKSE